jgi:hypothetical protein
MKAESIRASARIASAKQRLFVSTRASARIKAESIRASARIASAKQRLFDSTRASARIASAKPAG